MAGAFCFGVGLYLVLIAALEPTLPLPALMAYSVVGLLFFASAGWQISDLIP